MEGLLDMYVSAINSLVRSMQKKHAGKLFYYPSKISIETGNICNLACPLCPTADREQVVEKGMLSFEDFKVIFDKMKPFVKTIDLFSWGEPFLNKDIGAMIKYAKEKKPSLRIFIDSNFNRVTDDQIDAVARYGLNVLKVSCDGATQEVYEKYRKGGKLEDVLGNIKKLVEKKKELASDKPRIIWKYLVFKHNQHEVDKAREMARELGVEFEASGMRADCGKEIFEKISDSVERDKEWIPDDPKYNNYSEKKAGKDICEKPWRTLTVNWNGDVVPCGAIYDCSKYNYGNLVKQSFKEVWNSPKFVRAREIISEKRDEDTDLICATCKKNGYQFF